MCTVRFLLSKTSSQSMFDFVVAAVVVVVVVVFFPTPLKGRLSRPIYRVFMIIMAGSLP